MKSTVHTSKEYDVILQKGVLQSVPPILYDHFGKVKYVIVSDSTVAELYGKKLLTDLNNAGNESYLYVLPEGEKGKNVNNALDLIFFISKKQFTRSDIIIALGGGVTGDIAGFCSSVYMRGIRYVQIPTTLLADVDSSIGGKTGVNTDYGKNIIGSFRQPSLVIIDTDCLKTLSQKEFLCGVGEIIKYSVLSDKPQAERLKNGISAEDEDLESIISECIEYKKAIVEADEFDEKGIRNVLNLGHTFAHAIEKLSDYSVQHGFAVATGVCIACSISVYLGILSPEKANGIRDVVSSLGFETKTDYPADILVEAMTSDKKRKDRKILLVLPKESGGCIEKSFEKSELTELLSKANV